MESTWLKIYLRCDTVPLEGCWVLGCRSCAWWFWGDTREAADLSFERALALSADRWSMLLMERPIAAIGDKRDPDVFEATACRESGGKCRRKRLILLTNTNALKDVKSRHIHSLWPKILTFSMGGSCRSTRSSNCLTRWGGMTRTGENEKNECHCYGEFPLIITYTRTN